MIKSLYTRHGRKKTGLCVCEGLRCCRELLQAAPELVRFTVCREALCPDFELSPVCYEISDREFSQLAATIHAQGILCVAASPAFAGASPTDDFLPVLDRVGDPGNFGTILRTVRAAGLTELWYTEGSVDPFNDKTIRAATAAQFSLRLRGFPDLDTLAETAREYGYRAFYLTDPHAGVNLFTEPELYTKSVIIIGSEAHGVGEVTGAKRVTIPMPGRFESLNAAQAATVFLFEYVRRHAESG
ncbi:MAG: RNA methyltransferase [Victivallaceae bacterium]|nr:RNA methyltransferase [Victivallaceae bacterium]